MHVGSNNMNFSGEEEGENFKTVNDRIRSGSDNDQDERIEFEEQNYSCSSDDEGTKMETVVTISLGNKFLGSSTRVKFTADKFMHCRAYLLMNLGLIMIYQQISFKRS